MEFLLPLAILVFGCLFLLNRMYMGIDEDKNNNDAKN
jgi:hypothetical protein|tara:strand:- start:32050 stop:32160 length:111 start_codon:yes stop_codon:yes gene_type:complete